ncbi:MAG: glycosyltransferase [Lachnospiraceae bacterium]|nr:glycosyltransferase [Lachnospiraceae bacterium]
MRSIAFHLNCLTHGGTERVVSNLANRFAQEGYRVYVLTEWTDEDEFALDERVKRIHVGLKPEDEKRGRVAKFLRRVRYLREFLDGEKPELLVAFMRRANYRALMATMRNRIPSIVCVRIDPAQTYNTFTDRLQIRWLFPRAAGAVFQTEEQRAYFRPWLQENSRIILNPINEKYIGIPAPDMRDKAVVHAARLVDFKDQPTLVRAFLKVHERHPDYCLRIYGPDSGDGTKELLEELIRENSAQEWILLMGGCDTLEKELPRGEVFVSSSLFEGLPNAVMEAMALGLPVVSTDCPCGGPAMIIRDGENGLLVPVSDEEALAAAIDRLIEDRPFAEKLGQEARKISEVAGTEAVYRQWKGYFEEVIEREGKNTDR